MADNAGAVPQDCRALLEEALSLTDPQGETYVRRLSGYFAPTLKEDPAEAELPSHRLMIRAGLIRKLAGGIYSYLPLMVRSLRKLERIIREALNSRGAQEVLLPAVQPLELWQESGRDRKYGPELLRLKDRHGRDFAIGPTHEEVITDIIRRDVRSFRDLPLNLYQIQTKFRDEIRPRFGVMRGREFIMKDAYSFDAGSEAADVSYRAMYDAYMEIFDRCGFRFAAVEADSGAIGGSYSHEFMVLADSGENTLVSCPGCGYTANQEKAELAGYAFTAGAEEELTKVYTPEQRHVPELARFLKVPESSIIKSMLFAFEDRGPVLALIPGDREINLVKLGNSLGGNFPRLAEPSETLEVTGCPPGFVTPVGAKIPVVADSAVEKMLSGVVGTGEEGWHYTGAKPGRDFKVDWYLDIALAEAGDPCPRCGKPVELKKGIEVGHVFKLGTKYSEALNARISLADGSEALIIMGCYGIGLGRTVAASIEQSHDKDGIVWPMPLAPYEAAVLPLQTQNPEVMGKAAALVLALARARVETMLDDRDERPGLKFKDADLLGLPLRITVSEKSVAKGECELRERGTGKVTMLPLETAAETVREMRDKALENRP
ncbi:MAG: proline--tRNA ligase [Deltaproteobacteria bacterium]|jgi:prolyl-tRNA synthetase|nr:proline--tRNA ligase [Deltaproteobacteria bacterium]